jgi:hypothetical protein
VQQATIRVLTKPRSLSSRERPSRSTAPRPGRLVSLVRDFVLLLSSLVVSLSSRSLADSVARMSAHSSAAIHPPASTSSSLPSLPAIVDFSSLSGPQLASSIVVLLVTLLLAEQYYWRWRKGSLPGNKWQIVRDQPVLSATEKGRCSLGFAVFLGRAVRVAHHRTICRVAASFHGGLHAL